MAIKTLADLIGGEFKRIHYARPVPADFTGTRIYNQKNGEFNTRLGLCLPPYCLRTNQSRLPVQSALLEVMQEKQVTIRETHKVPIRF